MVKGYLTAASNVVRSRVERGGMALNPFKGGYMQKVRKQIKRFGRTLSRSANRHIVVKIWRRVREVEKRQYELEHEIRDLKVGLMAGDK